MKHRRKEKDVKPLKTPRGRVELVILPSDTTTGDLVFEFASRGSDVELSWRADTQRGVSLSSRIDTREETRRGFHPGGHR